MKYKDINKKIEEIFQKGYKTSFSFDVYYDFTNNDEKICRIL